MSQTFFCIHEVSLLITGILSILKRTKGYNFQDDEKTIIDIDIGHGHCCRKREKINELEKMCLYIFSEIIFFEK